MDGIHIFIFSLYLYQLKEGMRYLLLLLICLPLSKAVFSQCDNTLIGKWKVVAIKNKYNYINFKTDSAHITAEMAKAYPTDAGKKRFLALQKMSYSSFEFNFKNDNMLSMVVSEGSPAEQLNYCYTKSVNKIKITSKNSLGLNKTDEVPAMIKNRLLYLTLTEPDGGDVLELIMEKN